MTDLRQDEDALFDRWGPDRIALGPDPCHPQTGQTATTVRDGCVDPDAWRMPPLRLVLILDEVDHAASPGLFDLRDMLREGPESPQLGIWKDGALTRPGLALLRATWDNVTRWLHALDHGREIPWRELVHVTAARDDLRRRICAVDLNKRGMDLAARSDQRLDIAAERDAASLRRQLRLYRRPDGRTLFVCCGTAKWVWKNDLLEEGDRRLSQTQRGVDYLHLSDGHVAIDYCHPAARVGDPQVVYPLVDAIREILATAPR